MWTHSPLRQQQYSPSTALWGSLSDLSSRYSFGCKPRGGKCVKKAATYVTSFEQTCKQPVRNSGHDGPCPAQTMKTNPGWRGTHE